MKDVAKERSPELEWGNKVHDAFDRRIRSHVPFPADMPYEPWIQHLKPPPGGYVRSEMQLGMRRDGAPCDFFADQVWLRGKADCTVVDATGTLVALFDWKTGKQKEHPAELETQALLLKARHPALTVAVGYYVWLKDGTLGKQHVIRHQEIDNCKRRIHVVEKAMLDDEFQATPGPLCGWCPVKQCQHWKERP